MPPIKVSRHGGCPGAFQASQQHRTYVKSSSRVSFRKTKGRAWLSLAMVNAVEVSAFIQRGCPYDGTATET
jgi:hypothetical protein